MMKENIDIKEAYKIALDCNPEDEKVYFCCDLGDMWLFKFVPEGSNSYITGHFGFIVEKKSGKVGQYDMAANMSKIEGKTNLVSTLKC